MSPQTTDRQTVLESRVEVRPSALTSRYWTTGAAGPASTAHGVVVEVTRLR
jgi:hypothetical protein